MSKRIEIIIVLLVGVLPIFKAQAMDSSAPKALDILMSVKNPTIKSGQSEMSQYVHNYNWSNFNLNLYSPDKATATLPITIYTLAHEAQKCLIDTSLPENKDIVHAQFSISGDKAMKDFLKTLSTKLPDFKNPTCCVFDVGYRQSSKKSAVSVNIIHENIIQTCVLQYEVENSNLHEALTSIQPQSISFDKIRLDSKDEEPHRVEMSVVIWETLQSFHQFLAKQPADYFNNLKSKQNSPGNRESTTEEWLAKVREQATNSPAPKPADQKLPSSPESKERSITAKILHNKYTWLTVSAIIIAAAAYLYKINQEPKSSSGVDAPAHKEVNADEAIA